MSYTKLTLKSGNRKTGVMPVSMSDRSTCPPSCSFYGKAGGCYAEGWPNSWAWDRVDREQPAFTAFLVAVKALPEGTVWRHNTAGDLPGQGNAIDALALSSLVSANQGRRGFTYTHKPVTLEAMRRSADRSVPVSLETVRANRAAVSDATLRGFTVNVSCDSLAELDDLGDALPAVVVLAAPDKGAEALAPKTLQTPQGRRVVVCPAQYKDGVTCSSCGLCYRVNRACAVGFWAHGVSKRKISLKVAGTRPIGKRGLEVVQ